MYNIVLAVFLATATLPMSVFAQDTSSPADDVPSGTVTDDGNAGTIGERTLTPAERERCKEAPPNDATCQGRDATPSEQQ